MARGLRLALLLLAGATALGGARPAAGHEPDAAPDPGGADAPVPAEDSPWARPGAYLGSSAFFAAADFETPLAVDDAWGGRWLVGYRFHPHLAGELRGEVLSHFDLSGVGVSADLSGWSVAAHAKVYALTGRLQPYFTLGMGGFVADLEVENTRTGASWHDDLAVELFHVGLGLDVALSEHWYLNLEGTYALLGDDLDGVDFGAVGLGAGYRF